MRKIAVGTVLLRGQVELPDRVKVTTEDFCESWKFVCSGDAHWLDQKVRARGWHFIWIADPAQKGGIGQTSVDALASALRLALRRVSPRFNAAEVENIEVTKYAWFFLVRVRIHPCQIQQSADLSMPSKAEPVPVPAFGTVAPIAADQVVSTV